MQSRRKNGNNFNLWKESDRNCASYSFMRKNILIIIVHPELH